MAVITLSLILPAFFISACSKADDGASPADDSSTKIIGRAPGSTPPSRPLPAASPPKADNSEEKFSAETRTSEDAFAQFEKQLSGFENIGAATPGELLELGKVVSGLGPDDLELALDRILRLNQPALKSEALTLIFTRWAKIDPETAIARAENLEDEQSRMIAVTGAIVSWAGNDPDSAWRYTTEQKSDSELSRMLSAIVTHIANTNPQKAISLASGVENIASRNQLYQSISWNWAGTDPEAALEWVDTLNDPWMNRQARPNILGILAVDDPQAALNLAMAEADPQSRGEALSRILGQLASRNPDAAYAILENLRPDDLSESFRRTIGHALSNLDVEEVIRNITHLGPEVTNEYIASTAQTKIKQGAVEDAFNLVNRLPDGQERINAYSSLASAWAEKDSYAASEWLGRLSSGTERDSAIEGFSYSMMQADPESALIWAGSIDESAKRKYLIRRLTSQWVQKDHIAAQEWINTTELLDFETRQELLRIPTVPTSP